MVGRCAVHFLSQSFFPGAQRLQCRLQAGQLVVEFLDFPPEIAHPALALCFTRRLPDVLSGGFAPPALERPELPRSLGVHPALARPLTKSQMP